MKSQTCFFTGHRVIPSSELTELQKRLEEELVQLIERGIRYFGAGGALGFDTMAALTVLGLKPEFPQIRLILVLPCKDQARFWHAEDIKIYNQILAKADKVVYLAERYHNGCMLLRNRHMVDHSGVCICYLTKTSGGTAYTVSYAYKKGLTVKNLARQ